MRVRYADSALSDLRGIFAHISRDNRLAALSMVRGIRERCRALKQFPGSGEDCPQAAPGMRRSLHRGYGIYYRIESNSEIWIVRVLHPSIEFERQDFS